VQFAIISVGHNCARFIDAWYRSICRQSNNWRCYVAVDPSTDGTDSAISRLIAGDTRFHVVANSSRLFCLHNTHNCIALVDDPDTIVVTLDLDDAFYIDKALDVVASAYDDSTTWLTYGSYTDNHGGHANWCRAIPDHVWRNNSHRSNVWSTSALRTFKKWLWDLIKLDDFKLPNGQWYARATDRAFMYPMLEMSGPDHVKYIRETLYLYNLYGQHEPMLNDENLALKHILSKKPYHRLSKRPLPISQL
jgi:glycosyltransferase involved in cell wall biosynthesis